MPDSRTRELEIKISFLEKHVEAQDRAMMELANQLASLERHLKRLADSVKTQPNPTSFGPVSDERPPHY